MSEVQSPETPRASFTVRWIQSYMDWIRRRTVGLAKEWQPFVGLLVVMFIAWVASGLALYWCKDRGTFGDMFGGINALFSGLALAGVIYAIFLQKDELKLQRRELRTTRKELKGQKEAMQQQKGIMDLQRFENTFFNLLRFQNELVLSLETRVPTGNILSTKSNLPTVSHKGGRFFIHASSQLLNELSRAAGYSGVNNEAYEKDDDFKLDEWATDYFLKREYLDGHYYRGLKTVVEFVDRSLIESKLQYIDVVCSQLSSGQSTMIYLYCWSNNGESLRELVERYGLLRNLDFATIDSRIVPKGALKPSAFRVLEA